MFSRLSTVTFPLAAAAIAVVVLMPSDQDAEPTANIAGSAQASTRPGYVATALPESVNTDPAPATATFEVAPSPPAGPAPLQGGARTALAALPKTDVSVPAETLEEESVSTPRSIRVVSSAVNLRAGPSTSTAKLLVLQPGQKLAVTETSGGWSQVETESGDVGWVSSRYLAGLGAPRAVSSAAVEPKKEQEQRRVKPAAARVDTAVALRAGPSRSAPRLFVLSPKERVTIAEVRGRWIRVVMESGASGWIETRRLLQ